MAELPSTPRKRHHPVEYENIESVFEESEGYNAKVHGMVKSVSPMKGQSSTKFFDGYVTDGVKKLRFIGFNADKAKLLEQHASKKEPIALSNCCIKHGKYGNHELEIIVGDRTDISKSTIAFEVPETNETDVTEPAETKKINLSELQAQPPYQKIVTLAKVIDIDEMITLNDGRNVQNVVISDATGRANLSL
jgi:hypothetical protein